MQAIIPTYSFINEEDHLKKIELVARTCYKSEDKIKEGSAEKMVAALVKSKHYAMLEHSYVAFDMKRSYRIFKEDVDSLEVNMKRNYYFRHTLENGRDIVSANLRTWLEFIEDSIKMKLKMNNDICKQLFSIPVVFDGVKNKVRTHLTFPVRIITIDDMTIEERNVHQDMTVKFICDRGVSHEIVRHRLASFAQESQRYCNYGKDDQVTFILPPFFKFRSPDFEAWSEAMQKAERTYLDMIERGVKPQEARTVLPNSVKTEIVMTANLREWRHFFKLRAADETGAAHPQMHELTRPLLTELKTIIPVVFDDITYPGESVVKEDVKEESDL